MDCPNPIDKLFASAHLTETEKRVVQYVLEAVDANETPSIRMVSASCFTSMTTVTRAARKLGYDGFREMLYGLKRDRRTPSHTLFSSQELHATLSYETEDFERFSQLLATRELVGIYGEGYSHLISEYIQRKLVGGGYPVMEQSYLEAFQFIRGFADRFCMVILVSKSGETGPLIQTASECKAADIPIAAFVGNRSCRLAEMADMLFVVNDDQPLDVNNAATGSFTGCCILAFERVLYLCQQREG